MANDCRQRCEPKPGGPRAARRNKQAMKQTNKQPAKKQKRLHKSILRYYGTGGVAP